MFFVVVLYTLSVIVSTSGLLW